MTNQIYSAIVRVGELDVHYLTGGNGDPLLVVHGGTGGSQDWRPNIEKLMDKYTVYVPDLPGFGLTPCSDGDYFIPEMTEFIDGFAGAVGLDRFNLLGHSFGGGIALSYALKFPAKTTKLVLVSSLGMGKEIALWIRCLANRPFCRYFGKSALAVLKAVKWLMKQVFRPLDFTLPFNEASLYIGSCITGISSQTMVFFNRLSELVMPTLLVWGAKDPIVPFTQAYAAAAVIPNCRVRVFRDCGHSVYRDELTEFSQTLRGFLG